MFHIDVVEKSITHILYSITFIPISYRLRDNVKKYCRAGLATYDNMAYGHYMTDK